MELSKNQMGELIKKARKIKSKELGKRYTQVMLAKDIDMSQGYIGDIESGRTYPTLKVLNRIATACNLPMSFFSYEIDTDKINDSEHALSSSFDSFHIEHILPEFISNNPQNNDYFDSFKNYILMTKKIHDSLPDISFIDPKTNKTVNIEVKSTKSLKKLDDINSNITTNNYIDEENKINSNNTDILNFSDKVSNRNKSIEISDLILQLLSVPNLTLNGYQISNDVKISLENSIKLGLDFATQLQNKELELSKKNNNTDPYTSE